MTSHSSPLGEEGMADRLVAKSKTTEPGGHLVWTLYVTDQLVEAAQDWSPPVRFRFERQDDGSVEMWLRRTSEEQADSANPPAIVRSTGAVGGMTP